MTLSACFVTLTLQGMSLVQEQAQPTQPQGVDAVTTAPAALSPWSLGDATGINDFLKPTKFSFAGYADLGITLNPDSPQDHQNFGRLFDDRSNELLLNQLVFTLDRALDTTDPTKFDWGGRAQFMYGSDARFIHYTGMLDNATNDRVQPAIAELYLTVHLPVLTENGWGGVDLKAGNFVTLMGAETIDPRSNWFYSHTYMFNFGIPFNHTGGMATFHLPNNFNLMLGGVTGINTGYTDNNDSPAFHGGISWTSSDSKWIVNSALHIGPENDSSVTAFDANDKLRYITDTVITWYPAERWALIGDFVYGRDDGFDAEWYGAAGYVRYTVNDEVWLVGRAEVFRDDDGFAVIQYGDNDDPANAIRGLPVNDPRTIGGGATTYFALTGGINYKPKWGGGNLTIRPEVRWDFADVASGVSGGPFDHSTDDNQFTFAIDFILSF